MTPPDCADMGHRKICFSISISIGFQIVLSVELYVQTHTQTHTLCLAQLVRVWLLLRIGLLPALPLHPSMENNHKNRKRPIQSCCPMKGPAVHVQWRLSPLTGWLARGTIGLNKRHRGGGRCLPCQTVELQHHKGLFRAKCGGGELYRNLSPSYLPDGIPH